MPTASSRLISNHAQESNRATRSSTASFTLLTWPVVRELKRLTLKALYLRKLLSSTSHWLSWNRLFWLFVIVNANIFPTVSPSSPTCWGTVWVATVKQSWLLTSGPKLRTSKKLLRRSSSLRGWWRFRTKHLSTLSLTLISWLGVTKMKLSN